MLLDELFELATKMLSGGAFDPGPMHRGGYSIVGRFANDSMAADRPSCFVKLSASPVTVSIST